MTSLIPYSLATYIIRCDNFMNIHITNSHVIFAILTQYRWVSTSVIYFRCIYTSRNLGGGKKVSSYRVSEEKGEERVVWTCKILQTAR